MLSAPHGRRRSVWNWSKTSAERSRTREIPQISRNDPRWPESAPEARGRPAVVPREHANRAVQHANRKLFGRQSRLATISSLSGWAEVASNPLDASTGQQGALARFLRPGRQEPRGPCKTRTLIGGRKIFLSTPRRRAPPPAYQLRQARKLLSTALRPQRGAAQRKGTFSLEGLELDAYLPARAIAPAPLDTPVWP